MNTHLVVWMMGIKGEAKRHTFILRERSDRPRSIANSLVVSEAKQNRREKDGRTKGREAVGKMGEALTDQLSDGSSGRGRETKDGVSYKRVYFVPLGSGSDTLTLHPIPTAPPCFSVIEREALC